MAPARRVARAAAALLLLAVAAAGVEVARPRPHAQKPREHRKKKSGGDPGFDLFIFVRSYSPTFCKQEACTARPITAFTIHGLWPEYASGGWPQFCGDGDAAPSSSGASSVDASGGGSSGGPASSGAASSSLASSSNSSGGSGGGGGLPHAQLQPQAQPDEQGQAGREWEEPTRPPRDPAPPPPPEPEPQEGTEQQRCEWPSFKGTDGGFWDHEWEKHGTCARPLLGDRPAFFNATMRLHESLDLDVALAAAGIQPSDAASYPLRRLSSAVEDAWGVAPLLSCWHGQLLEVWLCVGLDLKVRTCPPGVLKAHRATCGPRVSLPLGSPVPAECRPYFPPWRAPSGGGPDLLFVRIATGVAVVGAGAAAVALMVRGARARRQRYSLLGAAAAGDDYDPLQRWLSSPTIKK